MIIIFNGSGMLVGAVGAFVGLIVAVLSGWLALGLLTLAVVWVVMGLWWRSLEIAPKVKRPFPALFFVPLPFLAIPAALLAVPMFVVEWTQRGVPNDPRAELLRADTRTLDSAVATGDVALSKTILTLVQTIADPQAKAEQYHVFTRIQGDAVLVLVKVPNLKTYAESARKQLLELIALALESGDQTKGKRFFIGVKGRLAFGATRVPPDVVKTGSVISDSVLYDFFGDAQAPPESDKASKSPAGS